MNRRRSIVRFLQQTGGGTGLKRGKTRALLCLLIVAACALTAAEPPRIALIEWYPRFPNDVSLHFDTAPNRTYTLQYLDRIGANANLTNSSSWGTWSNLYVADRVPFPNHYVIVDTATNSRQRVYRLSVTP